MRLLRSGTYFPRQTWKSKRDISQNRFLKSPRNDPRYVRPGSLGGWLGVRVQCWRMKKIMYGLFIECSTTCIHLPHTVWSISFFVFKISCHKMLCDVSSFQMYVYIVMQSRIMHSVNVCCWHQILASETGFVDCPSHSEVMKTRNQKGFLVKGRRVAESTLYIYIYIFAILRWSQRINYKKWMLPCHFLPGDDHMRLVE